MAGFPGQFYQAIQLPIAGGLRQRSDPRVVAEPFLDICLDAQFDETGGTQTRAPFSDPVNAITEGGGTMANTRKVARGTNGELLVFTRDTLYSANEAGEFIARSTHLAVACDETPVISTTDDQTFCTRAEVGGIIVYTWVQGTGAYLATIDKASGTMIGNPVQLAAGVPNTRPVCMPMLVANLVLVLFKASTGEIKGTRITPNNAIADMANPPFTVLPAFPDLDPNFDVAYHSLGDSLFGAAVRTDGMGYVVFTVSAGGVPFSSSRVRPAGSAGSPIAVALRPGSALGVVVRNPTPTTLTIDTIDSVVLTDVTVGGGALVTTAAPIRHVTALFRGPAGSGTPANQVRLMWTQSEDLGISSWGTMTGIYNVPTAAITSSNNLVGQLCLASHPFIHDDAVYVWLAFGNITTFTGDAAFSTPSFALQNTYFLVREDGYVAAKCVPAHGGGIAVRSTLPYVQTIGADEYVWPALQARRIEAANNSRAFAQRQPVEVRFRFDDNRARRTARLGRTLYVTGSEVKQYDGVSLVELGHHIYPWIVNTVGTAVGGGGLVPGKYAYKITLRYENAAGESDRSTTATIGLAIVGGMQNAVSIPNNFAPLTVTHKTAYPPAQEVWRSALNPDPGSPLFLATSRDPATAGTAAANVYVANNPALTTLPPWTDALADAQLTLGEANPENDGVLENVAPPGANLIYATDTRIFLGDIAGDPDVVWYSMFRLDGKVAQFNDFSLKINVPHDGGPMRALAVFDETLFVWRATALYAFPGQGLDNNGQGQNYGPVRIVSLDLGAESAEAVAVTPVGVLFKSAKGWHLMGSNGQLQYVGDAVADYDAEPCLAITVMEKQQHIRVLTSNRMLFWDHRPNVNQWGEWTIAGGLDAEIHRGAHVVLTAAGVRTQGSVTYGYGMDLQTGWLRPSNLTADAQNDRATGGLSNGWVRQIQPFGELRTQFALWLRIAYDYEPTYRESAFYLPDGGAPGDKLQFAYGLGRRKCESIRMRLTVVARALLQTAVDAEPSGMWQAWLEGFPTCTYTLAVIRDDTLSHPRIIVRDHLDFIPDTRRWIDRKNNTAIVVFTTSAGDQDPFVPSEDVEFAIAQRSQIIGVSASDPNKLLSAERTMGLVYEGEFPMAFPIGEGVRLTAFGMDVASEPGLYSRNATSQRR